METRRIGTLSVSAVGLGCNNFGQRLDEAQTKLVVDAALDAGVTFFDTADIYGGTKSEEYLGRALGARRKGIVLATKFGMPLDAEHKGARPEYVRQACAASLARLGTDYIDLYWLHTPDESVPIEETLGALFLLQREGKVREVGCSNFSVPQLQDAAAARLSLPGYARFVAVQNEFSLLHREPLLPETGVADKTGVLAECKTQGLAFVPYFPLASGLLSGKYRAGHTPPEGSRLAVSQRASRWLNDANLEVVEKLIAWVEAWNVKAGRGIADRAFTLLDLAIAWLLAQPQVASVIAGATTPEQVRANAAATEWTLSEQEVQEVRSIVEAGQQAEA